VEDIPSPVAPEPLLAILAGARNSIEFGNLESAIHQLQDLQEAVRARLGAVSPALSAQIIALAQFVIEILDPTGARRMAVAALAGTQLRVERLYRRSDNAWCVEGSAMPGTVCSVQRSTDLQNWEDTGFATEVDDGVFEFIDAAPTDGPALFYRMKER
jgi:hypothetical protein